MDRRDFLKSTAVLLGAIGSPTLLAACGGGGGIPEGQPQLNVTITTWEFLTGPERKVPILLRTLDNVQVKGGDVQVYLRDPSGEVLGGPFPTTYSEPEGMDDLGLYVAEFAVEQTGPVEVVAVEGDRFGAASINAVSPEDSKVPAPGDQAVSVATPTADKQLGYEVLCTQDPPCGMHEISLDDALAAGQPAIVVFATPEFCQTATCGPAVGTVDALRQDGDWGDAAWIHVEVYSKVADKNFVTGEAIRKWGLPSEPWLFSIDTAGKIAARLDGPMLGDMISDVANAAIA